MKKINKVSFEIEHIPTAIGVKISDLMSRCDLGVERITKNEIIELKTTTKIDKKYILKMEKKIKEAFELGGGKVFSIKFLETKQIY